MRSIPAAGHSIGLGSVIKAWLLPGPGGVPGGLLQTYPGALPTNSGTTALWVAMTAAREWSSGRNIILPSYTCPSVAAAALCAGLTPVLCDMEPGSFVLDKGHLESLIDDDTLAVVAVHLFGIPEDLEAIRAAAAGKKVVIIEDATQATANTDPATGQPLGTLGDVGVLSFGRGKPLSVLSGGAVVGAKKPERAVVEAVWSRLPGPAGLVTAIRYMAILMAYAVLFHPRLFWIPSSLPWFRVGETWFEQDFPTGRAGIGVTGMLRRQWPRLKEIRAGRERTARAYRSALTGCPDLRQPEEKAMESGLVRYPLVFNSGKQRDRALAILQQEGLGGTGMYPEPLHRIPGLRDRFQDITCRNAESVAKRILTLPLHDRVKPEDVERIATVIHDVCRHG